MVEIPDTNLVGVLESRVNDFACAVPRKELVRQALNAYKDFQSRLNHRNEAELKPGRTKIELASLRDKLKVILAAMNMSRDDDTITQSFE